MSLEFCVLASGSRANATILSWSGGAILIDCGLSFRELSRRLDEREFSLSDLVAVVITHEHSDHIAGLSTFAKRTNLPVYASRRTASLLPVEDVRSFVVGEVLSFGDLSIESFAISHDAVEPVALRVDSPDGSLAVVTDLGHVTSSVRDKVLGVDALILEANHDPVLLEHAPYPRELKNRISSRRGHLSNNAAASLLEELSGSSPSLEVVVAAHISEKSNDPSLVRETLSDPAARAGARLVVANQHLPSERFLLEKSKKKLKLEPSPLHPSGAIL